MLCTRYEINVNLPWPGLHPEIESSTVFCSGDVDALLAGTIPPMPSFPPTTNVRRYNCSYCDYSSVFRSNLDKHIRKHTGDKPFKCAISGCVFRTANKSNLNQHHKAVHGIVSLRRFVLSIPAAEADNPVVEDLSQAKRFRCEFCPYNSPFKCNLDKHVRRHKGEKPYAYLVRLRFSVLLSIPPVDIQNFEDSSQVKRFQCELCPYTTAFKCNLDKHIRRHRGEKPYGCTICDYATACQSHLAAHVRSCLRRRAISVDVNSTAMGPV
ncbi:transcriptional repressor CTCF-like [Varroa destructor]|uniref:C2H2-type domain-containing protein n=1 Tax=Varroa destructor TaxID=109461 RepID=A0A7M7KRA1_VARDE|nr:transcriptional repressor CTCF-like [Varroa destructor]